jgi:hypothetical protein
MELLPEWSNYNDLSITEASLLMTDVDPKCHFYRYDNDSEYAEYFNERGMSDNAADWIEPLKSGIRSGALKVTSGGVGNAKASEIFITKESFADWCGRLGKTELRDGLLSTKRTTPASNNDELHRHILQIADSIALRLWNSGAHQITARSIAPLVAKKVKVDERFNGQRGPLSEGTIRTRYLKGWKFNPPTSKKLDPVV